MNRLHHLLGATLPSLSAGRGFRFADSACLGVGKPGHTPRADIPTLPPTSHRSPSGSRPCQRRFPWPRWYARNNQRIGRSRCTHTPEMLPRPRSSLSVMACLAQEVGISPASAGLCRFPAGYVSKGTISYQEEKVWIICLTHPFMCNVHNHGTLFLI